MREILFRGKRKDNDEWVEGNYGEYYNGEKKVSCISILSKKTISGSWCYDVILETVGQFTGLTDKNGTKIFEGDIIRDADGDVMIVKWLTEGATFVLEPKPYVSVHFYSTLPSEIEVIGNIHDNSELLTE